MGEPFQDQTEYLTALLELVSLRLDVMTKPDDEEYCREAGQKAATAEQEFRQSCLSSLEEKRPMPLEYLFSTFDLSDFERHCVALALAPELDARYGAYYSKMQGGTSDFPSLDLCLSCYAEDSEEQIQLLSRWHSRLDWLDYIFRMGHRSTDNAGGLNVGLRLHPRLVDFILDCELPDPYLADLMTVSWDEKPLPELVLRTEQLEELERFSTQAAYDASLLFFLKGSKGSGRRTLVRHLCKKLDVPLIEIELEPLLQRSDSWNDMLLPVFREARLRGAALALIGLEELLKDTEAPVDEEGKRGSSPGWQGRDHMQYLLSHASQTVGMLFLISQHPWRTEIDCGDWQRAELVLDTPDAAGRLKLWKAAAGELPLAADVSLDSLANKFALEPGQVAAAVQEAKRLQHWEGSESITSEMLHRACRSQLPHNLSKMASRVNAGYTWEDLILPPEQKSRLQQACDQVEYRRKVYEEWGFGKKVAYGRGVSMLFSGPPGTGKTMAAQVIANRLGLELYKVDLSGVMSKYVGETEKQLGAVFDEVKKSQSILFFDEADALFGKRSETKDSHDRYANVQTSYLLQKIEDYDGIVILASNFLQNFDEAFKRRIKFIIDFTLPDRERREQIWRSVMPPELPRSEDVDIDFLARSFELSGSSIKNITVAAAFLAAAEECPVNMAHLLTATQAEQHKAGKSMGREEFGEYYHQVELYRNSRNRQE